ncbi:MAG: hypothetical protein J0H38_01030 [Rhizobiales bacterium]|nr:hypothetical protein [Hyphomicrobiales bacterium]
MTRASEAAASGSNVVDAAGRSAFDQSLLIGGRSPTDSWRVALHEAGHVVVGRALGSEVGGVTIVPGDGFAGLTWGPANPGTKLSNADGDAAAPKLVETIGPMMPGPGEARDAVADVFANVHISAIELMAGTAAETILHTDNPPWDAVSDVVKCKTLATLICSSERSIEQFMIFAFEEAVALINRHRAVVLAIAQALIDHPAHTLNAAEIDAAIASAVSRENQQAEFARREQMTRAAQSAARFPTLIGYDHAEAQ